MGVVVAATSTVIRWTGCSSIYRWAIRIGLLLWLWRRTCHAVDTLTIPQFVEAGRGILGITITDVAPDPTQVLSRYKNAFSSNPIALLLPPTMAQGSVPYSDLMAHEYRSNVLGSALPLVANMLFWLWFINFNVGIFNALPIGPLDGGQFYKSLIENRIRSRPSTLKNAQRWLR